MSVKFCCALKQIQLKSHTTNDSFITQTNLGNKNATNFYLKT